jgi:hypothetical protein
MKRLYLDTCCYNRPYDDLTQERIHLESEAIVAIIKRGQEHIDEIVGSDIIELEMEQSDDEIRKAKVKILYAVIVDKVHYDNGDYTKEKYNHPDLSLEEIDVLLRADKKPAPEASVK